jgi:hypothetical protein
MPSMPIAATAATQAFGIQIIRRTDPNGDGKGGEGQAGLTYAND